MNKLKYGKCTAQIFIDLKILNALLGIINAFDCRDIENQTTVYNCVTLPTLESFIKKAYTILKN